MVVVTDHLLHLPLDVSGVALSCKNLEVKWSTAVQLEPHLPAESRTVTRKYAHCIIVNNSKTLYPMFIAALFTIAKTWKQTKCPSTDEWIKKMWYIYTVEYYSAIKKNEIMPFAATWMELEIIILSEINQKKKDKYHMVAEG